jgi:hypothetical protein
MVGGVVVGRRHPDRPAAFATPRLEHAAEVTEAVTGLGDAGALGDQCAGHFGCPILGDEFAEVSADPGMHGQAGLLMKDLTELLTIGLAGALV